MNTKAKFKIGQLVEIITTHSHYFSEGDIGEIFEYDLNDNTYRVTNEHTSKQGYWVNENDIKAVSNEEINDVVIIERHNPSGICDMYEELVNFLNVSDISIESFYAVTIYPTNIKLQGRWDSEVLGKTIKHFKNEHTISSTEDGILTISSDKIHVVLT
jgi:hypothetical protein